MAADIGWVGRIAPRARFLNTLVLQVDRTQNINVLFFFTWIKTF
jgi:hypothetical protein